MSIHKKIRSLFLTLALILLSCAYGYAEIDIETKVLAEKINSKYFSLKREQLKNADFLCESAIYNKTIAVIPNISLKKSLQDVRFTVKWTAGRHVDIFAEGVPQISDPRSSIGVSKIISGAKGMIDSVFMLINGVLEDMVLVNDKTKIVVNKDNSIEVHNADESLGQESIMYFDSNLVLKEARIYNQNKLAIKINFEFIKINNLLYLKGLKQDSSVQNIPSANVTIDFGKYGSKDMPNVVRCQFASNNQLISETLNINCIKAV